MLIAKLHTVHWPGITITLVRPKYAQKIAHSILLFSQELPIVPYRSIYYSLLYPLFLVDHKNTNNISRIGKIRRDCISLCVYRL